MKYNVVAELQDLVESDEQTGLQFFRKHFQEALHRRNFSDCNLLLDTLRKYPQAILAHAMRHYYAILLYSQNRQLDEAENIFRNLLLEELSPQQYARTLLALGILLDEQGQWSDAEDLYLKAESAYASLQDQLGIAKTYASLGVCICFQVEQGEAKLERLMNAIEYHQKALTLLAPLDDVWEVGKNWHGLGRAYGLRSEYDAAYNAFQKDLILSQELEDENAQGITLSDLAALVYYPQKKWSEADNALKRAIKFLGQSDDISHLAEAYVRYGRLLEQQGHLSQALVAYEKAVQLSESIRNRLTAPTAQIDYRATTEFVYAAPLALHLRQGNAHAAFDAAERARTRVLVDLLVNQTALPQREFPENLLTQHQQLCDRLNQAYHVEDLDYSTIAEMESELASLDRQIELQDPAYASLSSVETLSIEQIGQQLSGDAGLLTYFIDNNDNLWAGLVSPQTITIKPIPKVKARNWLHPKIGEHLRMINPDTLKQGQSGFPLKSMQQFFLQLSRALIEPLLPLLDSLQTLYIIPSGPLHYIPLGALLPASDRRIVYAPSATILFNYCRQRLPSPHDGLLAVAPQDTDLQFTYGAAQTIAKYGKGKALIGSAATSQAFIEQANQYRALCFLGHAHFDQRYPMSSRLQFAMDNLRASDILRSFRCHADLVMLAACDSGRNYAPRGDEILGLSRALLYAGATSLLVTLWPVHEIPTRLLIEKFVQLLLAGDNSGSSFDSAMALTNAQQWLRSLPYEQLFTTIQGWNQLTDTAIKTHLEALWQLASPRTKPTNQSCIFHHAFFWSPYILIGDQSPNIKSARSLK